MPTHTDPDTSFAAHVATIACELAVVLLPLILLGGIALLAAHWLWP